MFVIIVGSGRLGLGLARVMSSRQDDVVIIDNDLEDAKLGDGFDGVVVNGDPMDLDILEQVGIRNAALFLAVTADDNVNVFCVEAARTLYDVPKVLARIADPERESFFHNIGVETVCPTVSGINQVLEFVMKDRFSSLATHLDPSLICIHPLESWLGKPPTRIQIPEKMKIVGVLKHGYLLKPDSREIIREEDILVVFRGKEKEGRIWIA